MANSILEQLQANDIGVMQLAKKLKVDRSAIYQAIDGGCSRYIRVEIALVLETKPSELWEHNDAKSLRMDDALYFLAIMENGEAL
jgi:predicted DNA-binding protein YlxM (UPF0122 family)